MEGARAGSARSASVRGAADARDRSVAGRATAYLRAHAGRFVRELAELVAFPSVSSSPVAGEHLRACARWLVRHLERLGARDARIVATRGHPIVVGRIGDDPARPSVLIYGHYDVQPAEPAAAWRHPPFAPVVRDGYLHGRGASDAKGQLFAHLKAIELVRHLHGRLPVNVAFVLEGEEEIGSPHLRGVLDRLAPQLASTVAVVSDNAVLGPDRPSITYALRGDLYLDVEVAGGLADLHSGNFGGAVDNALRVLVTALARLYGPGGRVAVPGFTDAVAATRTGERVFMRAAGPSDRELRREAGGAPLVAGGAFSAYERATIRPSIEIAGVAGGYVGSGIRGVIPARATGKLDLRLVPRQDPDRVHRLVFERLAGAVPRGFELRTRERMRVAPALLDRGHPAARAAARAYHRGFGVAPVFVRAGGSIPVVSALAGGLGVPTVLMGFALPDDRAHGADERFSLAMLDKAILTSAAFLEEIGR
ncbi:MAG TPA: M20/M25/M40 family metallo-hydrolase [Kofleriaceae bacterium]|nr:M20/M25/M40 family metallo-hydrolase [Kofleriaceae bacterium]